MASNFEVFVTKHEAARIIGCDPRTLAKVMSAHPNLPRQQVEKRIKLPATALPLYAEKVSELVERQTRS